MIFDIDDAVRRYNNPLTRRAAIIEFADWYRDLCLSFGSELDTAYAIAHEIARHLEKEIKET